MTSKIESTNQERLGAWRKFRQNPLAMAGLIFIIAMVLVSVFNPLLRPDTTLNANQQNLVIAGQKPGFQVTMIRVKNGNEVSGWFSSWLAGGGELPYSEVAVTEIEQDSDTLVAKLWSGNSVQSRTVGYPVNELMQQENGEFGFDRKFILGTDKYGRDLLSRLMAGASISLMVGFIAVLISLLLGLTLGLVAGFYRGLTDAVIMWFTNVIWAIPTLLLVMAITFAFGTGFWKVFVAVGLTMWVEVARIARGQVLGIREKEYIEAARALGFPQSRIIFRHVLPNILSPVIVISAANFAGAILIEAGLSFLGLGAQIPTPSWGNMIREHYAYITTDLAYLAIIPGTLIMLLVLSFMMVGNGLRDALDVHA